MRAALALCHRKNRFLFEVRPDLFPSFLTPLEIELWGEYYQSLGKHAT